MRRALTCLVLALVPATAGAQPAPRLPRADVSISTGWLNVDLSGLSSSSEDNWASRRATLSGQTGFYWTEHLKTELIAEQSNSQRVYVGEQVTLPGSRFAWRSSEHVIEDARLSIGQFYQFGHNAWTHLSLGAGVSVTRRQVLTDTSPLIFSDRDHQQVLEPGSSRSRVDTRANAFAAATLKAYVTPRVFVRPEAQADFRRDLDALVLRIGVGVDF